MLLKCEERVCAVMVFFTANQNLGKTGCCTFFTTALLCVSLDL